MGAKECNSTFKTILDLEWHEATQHKLNDNTCKLCDFSCNAVENLEKHIVQLHSFKCDYCPLYFQSDQSLAVHLATCHKCENCHTIIETDTDMKMHQCIINTAENQVNEEVNPSDHEPVIACEHIELSYIKHVAYNQYMNSKLV